LNTEISASFHFFILSIILVLHQKHSEAVHKE